MEDYEMRWQRASATPSRNLRASSASRDYRESSNARDYRESSVLSSMSRNVRASSVLPASLKHYDDLAEADEDYSAGSGYGYLNRGLHQAKRALSEARDILRATSVPRESSMSRYMSSSMSYDKKSRLEDIKEFSSEIERQRQESRNLYSAGTYKITVTPQAEFWSTRVPRRLYTRSTVAALLAAYSPRHFPDFIFGRYGGNTLGQPVSSTADFYDTANYHAHLMDGAGNNSGYDSSLNYNNRASSSARNLESTAYDSSVYNRASSSARNLESSAYDASNNYNRASSVARNVYDRSSVDLDDSTYMNRGRESSYDYYGRDGRSSSRIDDLYARSKYNYDYGMDHQSNIIKDKKKSKYYHYYIPRHYPGTPMRGGYIVNAGRDYGWKY